MVNKGLKGKKGFVNTTPQTSKNHSRRKYHYKSAKKSKAALQFEYNLAILNIQRIEELLGIPKGKRIEAELGIPSAYPACIPLDSKVLGDKRTLHEEGQYAESDDDGNDEPLWATGSDCTRPTGLKLSFEVIRNAIYSECH